MKNVNRWDIYFRNNPYSCFITEQDSGVILYYNDSFEKLLHLQESALGKTFEEIMGSGDNRLNKVLPNWDKQDVFEAEIYNREFNMNFRVRAALMYQQNVIFCELTPIEFELQANHKFEDAISKCMEIYWKAPNKIMISFMELLCEFYQCERAYVYRFNFENNTINCVAQWCEDTNFRVTEEIGTKMDSTFLINWLDKENETGIVMASRDDDDFKENPTLQKIMHTFKMENLTLCTVEDVNHKNVGLVGVSNRTNYHSFLTNDLSIQFHVLLHKMSAKGC